MTTLAFLATPGAGWSAILVFLGTCALTIVIVIAVATARRARRRFFETAARRLKGEFLRAGIFSHDRIEFPMGGRRAMAEFVASGEDEMGRTRVSVPLQAPSPGTLHILPDGFGQSFLKMFGAQDLSVGDPAFDAAYVVKATPASLAAQVFSPDRRARVISTVRGLEGFRGPTIEVTRDRIRVQVREEIKSEGRLVLLARTAEEFLEFLRIAPPVTGIQLGELHTSGESECPVCGTPLVELVVRCEACKTPHHQECWTYVGQCSTYACKGNRCVA